MAWLIILGWLIAAVLSYLGIRLLKKTVAFMDRIDGVSYPKKEWTNLYFVLCGLVSLIGGPFCLLFVVYIHAIFFTFCIRLYVSKKLKMKPDSWWNKKSKF